MRGTILKELIDRLWFIDYEKIPDDPDCPSPYVLAEGSDQEVEEDMLPFVQRIKISHDDASGYWRFDADTVDMIVTRFIESKETDEAGK